MKYGSHFWNISKLFCLDYFNFFDIYCRQVCKHKSILLSRRKFNFRVSSFNVTTILHYPPIFRRIKKANLFVNNKYLLRIHLSRFVSIIQGLKDFPLNACFKFRHCYHVDDRRCVRISSSFGIIKYLFISREICCWDDVY